MQIIDQFTHSVEGIGFLVMAGVWIYDRLKNTETATTETKELSERIDTLDEKLTTAMTTMATNISTLAVSVGRLEGRFEEKNARSIRQ